MGTIFTIFTILILIVLFYGKQKGSSPPPVRSSNRKPEINPSSRQTLVGKDWSISVSMPNYKTIKEDNIIDVTGQGYYLEKKLKKYVEGVPYWAHHYVYSYSEINSATSAQKRFYSIYKNEFLKGEYLDLEGNTNYAFILLFDLLEEYDIHKNSHESEKRIEALGNYYPKTARYGMPFLIKRMQSHGDYEGISRLRQDQQVTYQGYYQYSEDWKLGTKYKAKLDLTESQVQLLNRLWVPNNNFCSIEFCRTELVKLFLVVIKGLEEYYIQVGASLEVEFKAVADVIAKKQYRYRAGSTNYNYSMDSIFNEIYAIIFKLSENELREKYGHKRKVNIEMAYVPAAEQELEAKILVPVKQVLVKNISMVQTPDNGTEIELNAQNTSRWKISFDQITSMYNDNAQKFYKQVLALGELNKKNPSIENIFFESSKFISKYDKEASLKLYAYYIYHDLQSKTFDNKQLTKTIQKNLFKTNDQLREFEIILSDLIKSMDLNHALERIPQIYVVKRKQIKLDKEAIKDVHSQHADTVELLNEYLQDEYEDESTSIKSHELNTDEVEIDIIQKSGESTSNSYMNVLSLSPIQIATIEYFVKSNYAVAFQELEAFAKLQGSFKNHLIESINEACYDRFDDVLIDEEDNAYILNENYYHQLLTL
jgi:hypothetical protein